MSFSCYYFAASIVWPSGWWKWTADLRWIGNGICCLMVKSWRLRPALVTRSDWPVVVVFVVVSGSIQTHHGRGEVEIDFLPECWNGEFECCLRRPLFLTVCSQSKIQSISVICSECFVFDSVVQIEYFEKFNKLKKSKY